MVFSIIFEFFFGKYPKLDLEEGGK